MSSPIHRLTTRAASLVSNPAAFLVLIAYVVVWRLIEPHSLDWHGFATVLTLFMTIVITRSEHRDTAALQAKLDELIKATEGARDEVKHIDEKEVEEIEAERGRE